MLDLQSSLVGFSSLLCDESALYDEETSDDACEFAKVDTRSRNADLESVWVCAGIERPVGSSLGSHRPRDGSGPGDECRGPAFGRPADLRRPRPAQVRQLRCPFGSILAVRFKVGSLTH